MCLGLVLLLSRGSTVIIYSAVEHAGMVQWDRDAHTTSHFNLFKMDVH